MKTLLIEFTHRSCIDNLTSWVSHMSELGFNEVILVSEDSFEHPDLPEITRKLDSKVSNLLLMTDGSLVTQKSLRNIYGEVIFPLDWYNPFTGNVVGQNNYNRNMEFILNTIRAEVWQTYLGEDNQGQIQNMMQRSAEFGFEWRCYLYNSQLPDQLVGFCQQYELPIIPPMNWEFVHEDKHIPDEYYEDIVIENNQYTGALYLDKQGIVHSVSSDEKKKITDLHRSNISELAIDTSS